MFAPNPYLPQRGRMDRDSGGWGDRFACESATPKVAKKARNKQIKISKGCLYRRPWRRRPLGSDSSSVFCSASFAKSTFPAGEGYFSLKFALLKPKIKIYSYCLVGLFKKNISLCFVIEQLVFLGICSNYTWPSPAGKWGRYFPLCGKLGDEESDL